MTTDSVCAICSLTFIPDEWEDRHSASDGEDVHAHCCDICHGGTTSSGESINWNRWPDDEVYTAKIYGDRAEWCLTVERLDGHWCWEVAERGPDPGPYLDSWIGLHGGDAGSLEEAQTLALRAVELGRFGRPMTSRREYEREMWGQP